MSTYEILIYPHETLRKVAEPVSEFNEELAHLVENMTETMYLNKGIGLAATQVNITKRVLVLDVSEGQDTPEAYINPEIIDVQGRVNSTEGCLSIPDFRESITRHERIKVRAQKVSGETFEIAAEGLHGICLQHEIDHLNGIMFTDHLSFLKKQFFNKWLKKNQK